MKIEVKQPGKEELEGQGVFEWPIWEKEISRFDWHYDSEEICFLLEGRVEVTTPDGQAVIYTRDTDTADIYEIEGLLDRPDE